MRDLFALAQPVEPGPVPPEPVLEANEDADVTWAFWAAHLLVIVQDDGPDSGGLSTIEVLQDCWNDFLTERELPPERTGYSEVALGRIYGVPAVRFYDTDYSAMVFRADDLAKEK